MKIAEVIKMLNKKASDGAEILEMLIAEENLFKAQDEIQKNDKQTATLIGDIYGYFVKRFSLTSREQEALNKLKRVSEMKNFDDARNQIFQAADALGLKLPSKVFASAEKPVLFLETARTYVNQAFADEIQKKHSAMIVKEPSGFLWVHEKADKDPSFNGGNEYDFHFLPQKEGWFTVLYKSDKKSLLIEEAKKMDANVVRGIFPDKEA